MAWKRKLKWVWAVITVLYVCGATAWLLWLARHPTARPLPAETYERLSPGMTRAEAEELLGGPGGSRQEFSDWLNNRSPVVGAGTDLLNEHRNEPGIEYRYQDSGVIIVRFDSEDRVADKQFLRVSVSTSRQRVARLLERFGW
jgi:hypothetical protein